VNAFYGNKNEAIYEPHIATKTCCECIIAV